MTLQEILNQLPPVSAKLSPVPQVKPKGLAPMYTAQETPPPVMQAAMPAQAPQPMRPATPSQASSFQPKNAASLALSNFVASSRQPVVQYKPAPVRDFGQENRNTGQSALMAGLFGLGLGSVGGVAAAPTLAAAAAGGARTGADERFVNQARQVQQENALLENQAQEANRRYQDSLRAYQVAAQDENMDNQQGMMSARYADQMEQEQERNAQIEEQKRAAITAKTGDAIRAERKDFLEQLSNLDAESQQAMLAGAAQSGDLDRLNLSAYFPRGADGKFGATLRAAPKDYSPLQDPRFVNLRDRSKRLQELLKPSSNITPEYRAQLSQELATVEKALGVGTGVGLPPEAFMPMTPYQAVMAGESAANRQQRGEEFTQTNALAQARLELEKIGVRLRENQYQLDMQEYLTKKKTEWTKDGLSDINKIGQEIFQIREKIAQLRTGRTIVDKYGDALPPVPPSPDERAAADALEVQIQEKQNIQDAIAGRYAYKRAGQRWVPMTGNVSIPTKKTGSTGGKTGAITLPPIPVGGGLTTPTPSLFGTVGKKK